MRKSTNVYRIKSYMHRNCACDKRFTIQKVCRSQILNVIWIRDINDFISSPEPKAHR